MRYVLFYELAEGAGGLAQEHFPAHRARLDAFHERGDLLLVGTFTDLPMGAMAVFTSREPPRSSWRTTRSCCTAWWGSVGSASGTRSSRRRGPYPEPSVGRLRRAGGRV
jgi:hypothetical protein